MNQVYVFVEGPTDAEFLRRILPPELLKGAEVVSAGGSSGIASLARSVLVRRKKPVVVVMDADSTDPELIAEIRDSMEELIQTADASIPVKVVAVAPAIEAWLFAAPKAIARALGESVPSELVPLGKRDPSGVLQQLAAKRRKRWDPREAIGLLDAHDVASIRALPEVNELSTFLKSVQQTGKAA